MTGCGCLILVGLLVGGILFMIFGSTDAGEPIAQGVALATLVASLLLRVLTSRRRWMTFMPLRRALVRVSRA